MMLPIINSITLVDLTCASPGHRDHVIQLSPLKYIPMTPERYSALD